MQKHVCSTEKETGRFSEGFQGRHAKLGSAINRARLMHDSRRARARVHTAISSRAWVNLFANVSEAKLRARVGAEAALGNFQPGESVTWQTQEKRCNSVQLLSNARIFFEENVSPLSVADPAGNFDDTGMKWNFRTGCSVWTGVKSWILLGGRSETTWPRQARLRIAGLRILFQSEECTENL